MFQNALISEIEAKKQNLRMSEFVKYRPFQFENSTQLHDVAELESHGWTIRKNSVSSTTSTYSLYMSKVNKRDKCI